MYPQELTEMHIILRRKPETLHQERNDEEKEKVWKQYFNYQNDLPTSDNI